MRKLAEILAVADYRMALRVGTAATVEHSAVPFASGVRMVIDVGANRGQFAAFALHHFPGSVVHAFEPLPFPFATLRSLASRNSGRLFVHDVALGSADGDALMHQTAADDSSSLLQPSSLSPSPEVTSVATRVRRLDSVLSSADLIPPVLLKIDVQGYELEVLRGTGKLLRSIEEVFVELSFQEFYKNQSLGKEVEAFLEASRFERVVLRPTIRGKGGRVLQADALFRRIA